MNSPVVLCLCFFALLQIFQSQCLTIDLTTTGGNRRSFSIPLLSQTSTVPAATFPMARKTLSTNVNISTVSTIDKTDTDVGTVFPSTQTTVGTVGFDVLLRGTELVADRIVSALGGIAMLIDLIRNTSLNGDIAWNNVGSSSQIIANRLVTVSMNTANNLLQQLNNQLAVSANPNAVLQSFMNIFNIERLALPQGGISAILRSKPRVFFPNRVFSVQDNASGAVPVVTEIVNSSTGTNNCLPSITTTSTTRPGLNIPPTTDNPTSASDSITSQVETFLENLGGNTLISCNMLN